MGTAVQIHSIGEPCLHHSLLPRGNGVLLLASSAGDIWPTFDNTIFVLPNVDIRSEYLSY